MWGTPSGRFNPSMRAWATLAFGAFLVLPAGQALADPCKAVPDRGPTPAELAPGRVFEGPVVYVGDGDSLCVALGSTPAHWAEIRLSDVFAPELAEPGGPAAKAVLEQVAMGRRLTCIAGRRSYDRVVAACRLGGRSLAALLRAAGAREGGRGWPSR